MNEEEVQRALSALSQAAQDLSRSLASGLGTAAGATAAVLASMTDTIVKSTIPVVNAFGQSLFANNSQFLLLAFRTTQLTSAIYGAEQAFQSVVPTLSNITSGIRNLLGVLPSFGPLGAGIRGLGTVLEKASGILTFQLEASEKVVSSFNTLSNFGIIFGGSIQSMADSAVQARVPIQLMTKVIQANMEQIAGLGTTMEFGARMVTNFTSDIFRSANGQRGLNDAVLALYGSFENVSEGVAGYLSLVKKQGIDLRTENFARNVTNDELQTYLIRLKELSAFTGKSIKNLQAEEAERQQSLAYNLEISKVGKEAAAQFAMVENIAAKAGPEMVQLARSLFSGVELTVEQRQLAATAQPFVDMIRRMTDASKTLNPEEFRRQFSQIGKEAAPELRIFAESLADISRLPPGTNTLLDNTVRIANAARGMYSDLANLPETVAAIAEDSENAQRGLDDTTKTYLNSMRQLIDNQLEIDYAITGNMARLNGLINLLSTLQTQIIRFQTGLTTTMLTEFDRRMQPGAEGTESDSLQSLAAGLQAAMEKIVDPTSQPATGPTRESLDAISRRVQQRLERLGNRINQMEQNAPIQTPAVPAAPPTPTPTPAPTPPAASEVAPQSAAPVTTPVAQGPTEVRLTSDTQTTLGDFLAQLRLNNDISLEQRGLLDDILRIQNNILNAVA